MSNPVKLKHKITLLWATVMLVLVAMFLAAVEARSRIHVEERAEIEREARLATLAFSEYTSQVVNQVDALLNSVRQFYLRTGSIDETEGFINTLGFDNSIIDNIYLIDAQGKVTISHDPATRGRSTTDRDYFQALQTRRDGRPFISGVEAGRITGKLHFRIASRVSEADGSFAGIVLATINPQAFANYYQLLSPGTQRAVTLLSTEDRKLRARMPEPAVAQWALPVESPLWQQLEQSPSGTYQTRSFVDGIERTYYYQKMDHLPLVILLGFSVADIEQRVDLRFKRLVFIELAAAIFILMLSIVLSVLFIGRDRDEQANKKLQALYQQMRNQAMFDGLTGLPNRPMFFDHLSKELSAARRNDKSVGLLFLDLDGFKRVNDEFGHDAGDTVLKTVAKRWLAVVREMDTVARLGGDEFAIIVGNLEGSESAGLIAQKLLDALSSDIELSDGRFGHVGSSIGIAIYPDNATEIDSLLAAADAAMYVSKSRGKNTFSFSDCHPANQGSHDTWLSFNDSHLVGIAEIDNQHRQLVGMVNQINQAIIAKATQDNIERQFKELIAFTLFHFETEDRLMAKYAFPGQSAHHHEHERLVGEVTRIASELQQGNDLLVLQTIKDWLIDHIQNADKPLGTFLVKCGLS